MLKLFGFFIKFSFFSILVLILGNWLSWDGMTISDQIKLKMSHAEESGILESVRDWADKISRDAKKGFQNKVSQVSTPEEIPSSERQKLKALIRELNGSRKKD